MMGRGSQQLQQQHQHTHANDRPQMPTNIRRDAYAYVAQQQHFRYRSQWWTTGTKRVLKRWSLTLLILLLSQGIVALPHFVVESGKPRCVSVSVPMKTQVRVDYEAPGR